MTKEITLPARMDYASLDAIYAEIKEARGEDISLDGSQIKHLGASGLQLLLSASKSWEQDGHSLEISNPTPKFFEHLKMLGIEENYFSKSESEQ